MPRDPSIISLLIRILSETELQSLGSKSHRPRQPLWALACL